MDSLEVRIEYFFREKHRLVFISFSLVLSTDMTHDM